MATTYTAYTQRGTRYIKLVLTETTNVTANTSNIHWALYFGLASGGYQYNTHNAVTMTLGGQTIISTSNIGAIYYSSGSTGEKLLQEGDWTYAHASDGTGSFAVYCQFNQTQSSASGNNLATISETYTATAIPRTSSFASNSPSTFTLGTASNILIDRKLSGAKHKVLYWIGSQQYIAINSTPTTATTISWTPPLSLASQSTTETTLSGTMYLDTWTSGDVYLGRVSKSITVRIPTGTVKPGITSTATAEANTSVVPASRFSGTYVQGKSRVRVSVTPNLANEYGATIKSCVINIGGTNYNATASGGVWSATSGVLSTSGSVSIRVTLTDTRGATGTATTSITVTAYSAPTISLTAFRCDADGNADDTGEYISFEATNSYTSLSGKNTYTITVDSIEQTQSGSVSTRVVNLSSYSSPVEQIISGISLDDPYVITARVSDYWTSVSQSVNVGTAFVLVDYHTSGRGLAIGKVAQTADLFEEALPAQFDDNLTVQSADASNRLIRLKNSVRNVRQQVYATGYWGLYDDTNGAWIIRSDPSTQDINIPHRLLLEGHSSAVGDIYEGSIANNVTLTANAWNTVVSNTFPAGSWIITGYVTIPTGTQGAGITITMSSIGSSFARQSVYAHGGASYSANVTGYIKLTENTTVTLQVWSASAITVTGCIIRGIRIA